MSLSVGGVSCLNFSSPVQTIKKQEFSHTVSNPSKGESDLNLNPNNIAFNGLFFNRKKNNEHIHGPFKITAAEQERSAAAAKYLTEILASGIEEINNKQDWFKEGKEAPEGYEDEMVEKLMPLYMTLLTGYPKQETNFPQFCDMILVQAPLCCDAEDRAYGFDYMTKIYEKMHDKIEEKGREIEPDYKNPIKAGLASMYYDFNTPALKMKRDEYAFYIVDDIKEGIIPEFSKHERKYPMCHMSTIKNEINDCDMENIKEQYGYKTPKGKYTNMCGEKANLNYALHDLPKPQESYGKQVVNIMDLVDYCIPKN